MPRTRKAAPRFSMRRVAIAAAVAAAAAPVIFLGYKYFIHSADKLETALIHLGFYPITPPSKLVVPGSIYLVSKDGRLFRTICEADQSDTAQVTKESEAPEVVSSELLSGRFQLDVDPTGEVNKPQWTYRQFGRVLAA
jgi:hypothetical protein